MWVYKPPENDCATCRYVAFGLERFPVPPNVMGYYCEIKGNPFAPRATMCRNYEREPGAD